MVLPKYASAAVDALKSDLVARHPDVTCAIAVAIVDCLRTAASQRRECAKQIIPDLTKTLDTDVELSLSAAKNIESLISAASTLDVFAFNIQKHLASE